MLTEQTCIRIVRLVSPVCYTRAVDRFVPLLHSPIVRFKKSVDFVFLETTNSGLEYSITDCWLIDKSVISSILYAGSELKHGQIC